MAVPTQERRKAKDAGPTKKPRLMAVSDGEGSEAAMLSIYTYVSIFEQYKYIYIYIYIDTMHMYMYMYMYL